METSNIMYTVTLTNDSMPFADDARYDVDLVTLFVKEFTGRKEAAKFFKSFAKENGMRIFGNEASGNNRILHCNF